MTKTFRFRDFVIYKNGKKFRKIVRTMLTKFPKEERYRLVDQIDRATLSVILNIAEGSAKKSDKEFLRFLETAISSLNEVIAGFDCAEEDAMISPQEMRMIEQEGELLARQIGSFMKTLKKTHANCS